MGEIAVCGESCKACWEVYGYSLAMELNVRRCSMGSALSLDEDLDQGEADGCAGAVAAEYNR